jgi:putative membrane protein
MHRNEFILWSVLLSAVMALAFYGTADRVNWMLDACWVVVGVPLLVVTRNWFPLTPLLYRLLAIHALVLIGGGYWTYEKMPIGLWLQDLFQTERNQYDRFGHFMQGFVPAIIFREVFVRTSPVKRGWWLVYFVLASCLAFSALFELIEWWATLLAGADGGEFLGHQGDIWDAQWDMLCAILGSVTGLALLSQLHDRHLQKLAAVDAKKLA